ncbi:MAG: V-type ATP synthase subunit D [Anaerococcus sp.]|uniref:V-type ATP synthase subunit D n=1 Tax=Anaerococcus sp. TaxID=1872515 RepID=UPI00262A8521|nr:V-type ATP synthase subunit D [Anaerococcus sp.]MCI5972327.1 V-type ATP synthase subunit D [Anaerococcus sp.]MDD6918791.1 V-type ATP synthase subunit D [Peptoniphilaceae bacterium]MDY2927338.1 V-type ATP synthase subunit D [Anaerococcus sp.]
MQTNNVAATKANLIKAKEELNLLEGGYDILDKKRKALIGAYDSKIKERNDLNEKVNETIKKVSHDFKKVLVSIGESDLDSISKTVPIDNSISLKVDKFMQTEISEIYFEDVKLNLSYSFYETNAGFDEAILSFNQLRSKIFKLAELDTTINSLDREIKKTSKKVNSLDKVQIPKYKEMIKTISQSIEEKEREEFSKTKIVKENKIKKEESKK